MVRKRSLWNIVIIHKKYCFCLLFFVLLSAYEVRVVLLLAKANNAFRTEKENVSFVIYSSSSFC